MAGEEMNNPYEQEQINILDRIIKNIERLNQKCHYFEYNFNRYKSKNKNLEIMGKLSENYNNNLQFNLEASGKRNGPL
ncbi:hypothetical protein TPHA_0E01100 [Tetrapisispora phaffii CBS 4417]|uniref:DASH complex subunit DAD4 n=1 Tax=Tetrapisispora phaffii (strain ATCC 24235 / CBS 4417 / NBRC 1672 / NRRL Y-8282 / UCD 70-5) TaxID=1071381 RepID=G8BTH6_TETPH|nr:hypothetical protein TPHA_0E01100 [Tetrapisispora phaffii CBS 4417]CCE63204.1 hypothetical protein TPHA_0E01100 [Tetrapisispora phaffii CBS 4417]